jgi:hypothetical protein
VAIGWGGGLILALLIGAVFYRRRSSATGFRIEQWRAEAVQLRLSDPDKYQQVLAQAVEDPAVRAAAQRDPDAWVALVLSHATEAGSSDPPG